MYIYCLPILTNTWEDIDTHLLQFVSPKRQEKVLKYRYSIDQKLSLYAALVTRMGLSTAAGIPASELSFFCSSDHKPFSDTDYHFNFSHTRNFILCCISIESPVGADVEKLSKAPFDTMNTAFHREEISYINHSSVLDRDLLFYKIWTRKEAYTKYLGTGLITSLPDINTLSYKLSGNFFTWQEGGYICSVYQESNILPKITKITEEEIQNYFLNPSSDLPH